VTEKKNVIKANI